MAPKITLLEEITEMGKPMRKVAIVGGARTKMKARRLAKEDIESCGCGSCSAMNATVQLQIFILNPVHKCLDKI